jgi:hypothetical protein
VKVGVSRGSHSGGIGLGVGLAEGRAVGSDLASIGSTINNVRKGKEDVSILLKIISETKIKQHHRSSYLQSIPKDRLSQCLALLLRSHRLYTIEQQVPAEF